MAVGLCRPIYKESACLGPAGESHQSSMWQFLRGLNEAFEERAELTSAVEILRVPLNAEAEAARGIFDRFDHAIRRGGG